MSKSKQKSPSDRRRNFANHNSWNPVHKVEVDPSTAIWCTECDWHQIDCWTARTRLGHHMVNEHPELIMFKRGTLPPDFVDEINPVGQPTPSKEANEDHS
jgi:hypothetical protein